MVTEIVRANKEEHASCIQELIREYLQWVVAKVNEEFGANLNVESVLETDMKSLEKYMPPGGRLLLCYVDKHLAGMACLKKLSPGVGEVKRMYVRPDFRKSGLGRTLLNRLLEEALQSGYECVRLDSGQFMKEAHQLYRSMGFSEIEPYDGSEIPKEFQAHSVFMEMDLSNG